MKKLISILIICLLNLASFGQTPKSEFLKAEKLYKKNKFEEALAVYHGLIKNKFQGKSLFYNIGNCYFKLEKLGMAIAYYEKAMKIDPSDKDIIANLRLVNSKTDDKINFEEKGLSGWFNKFSHIFNPDTWTKYGLIFWTFAFLTFFLVRMKYLKKSFEIISWLGIIVALVFLSVGYIHHSNLSTQSSAVIIESTVQVKASPTDNSKNLYILHEGAKVNLHQTRESWYEISIDNDNYGWVQKSEAEII